MNNASFYVPLLFVSMLLAGCCSVTDSTVNDGYPYGAYHELRFNTAKMKFSVHGQKVLSYMDSQHISYFTNKDTCDKVLRVIDGTCDCSSEDLTGKALVYIYGSVPRGYVLTEQPRILINHKAREYVIELRGYGKDCRSQNPSPSFANIFSKWVIAPRPPDGYKIIRKNIEPFSMD